LIYTDTQVPCTSVLFGIGFRFDPTLTELEPCQLHSLCQLDPRDISRSGSKAQNASTNALAHIDYIQHDKFSSTHNRDN